jgi:hypothetical protein
MSVELKKCDKIAMLWLSGTSCPLSQSIAQSDNLMLQKKFLPNLPLYFPADMKLNKRCRFSVEGYN